MMLLSTLTKLKLDYRKIKQHLALVCTAVLVWFYARWRFWIMVHEHTVKLKRVKALSFPLNMLGMLPHVNSQFSRIFDWKLDNAEKFGSTHRYSPAIWETGKCAINTSDPSVVKHILKSNYNNYLKSPKFRMLFNNLLGNGIFGTNHGPFADDQGQHWLLQRKTMSKIFTANMFDGYINHVFQEHTVKMMERMDEKLQAKSLENADACQAGEPDATGACQASETDACHTDTSGVLDMQTIFSRFALDGAGNIGLGVDFDSQSKDDVPFATAFDRVQFLMINRVLKPFWNVFGWLYSSEREIQRHMKTLNQVCYEIIAKRRRELEAEENVIGDSDTKNIETKLGAISHEESKASSSETDNTNTNHQRFRKDDILSNFIRLKSGADDKMLRDVVISTLIAGRDTTSSNLSFTFLLLAQHQDAQEQLYEEVKRELQSKENASGKMGEKIPMLSMAEAEKLSYLYGVTHEALRLFPPVALDPKWAAEDDEIVTSEGETFFVPAGAVVTYEQYVMGHSKKIWGEDVEEFKPERWFFDSTSDSTSRDTEAETLGDTESNSNNTFTRRPPTPFEFPVFQAGPRSCLGKNMVEKEVMMVTAALVYNYHFDVAYPGRQYNYRPGVTLTVDGGLPLRVTPRPSHF